MEHSVSENFYPKQFKDHTLHVRYMLCRLWKMLLNLYFIKKENLIIINSILSHLVKAYRFHSFEKCNEMFLIVKDFFL